MAISDACAKQGGTLDVAVGAAVGRGEKDVRVDEEHGVGGSAGGAAFASFGTKLAGVTAGPGRVARVTRADEGLQRVGARAHRPSSCGRWLPDAWRLSISPRPTGALTETDWRRCAELVEHYTDLRLDLIDASLVAVAERLGAQRIARMNRRDFAVVRPRHVEAFELVP